MKVKELVNRINSVEIENHKSLVIIASKLFSIKEIELIFKSKLKKAELSKKIKNNEAIEIDSVRDVTCDEPKFLVLLASAFVNSFQKALDVMIKDQNYSSDYKKSYLQRISDQLSHLSDQHDCSNIFSFVRHDLFYIEIEREKIHISYGNCDVSESCLSQIREMFQIRKDFFQELKKIAKATLFNYELTEHENDEIEFQNDKGPYILAEFVLALDLSGKIKFNKGDSNSLFIKLLRVFGLNTITKNLSYYSNEINDKKTPSVHLKQLAKAFEEYTLGVQKIKEKNKKK